MDGRKIITYIMILIEVQGALVQGAVVQTAFEKISGDGPAIFSCARNSLRSVKFTGFQTDTSNKCTNFGWDWEQTPSFENGTTYFEKKHILKIYHKPVSLEGKLPLPIVFRVGSTIDMYISVTDNDIMNGYIQLVDTFDDKMAVDFSSDLTVMINMDMLPNQNTVTVKSYHDGWDNHNTISPYPFSVGTRHKISFKALTRDIQILFDDEEVDRYKHQIQPEHARLLKFHNVGMELLKIEFVNV